MRKRCRCGGYLSHQSEITTDGPLDYVYCHSCGRRVYRPARNMPRHEPPVPAIRGY
ncbi:MAG: hypothetical protein ACOYL3_22845 [Desulfuromonadaceae bacterium]